MRLAPLRSFDRVVAGYATIAFAIGAARSVVTHEWMFVVLGATMSGTGVVLLVHDHHRWRARRRRTGGPALMETS